ncbi:virulence factor TspB C-terminal domain-related protein [Acinetobacter ursingii]|uniref:virulence factor TspB C-terminal domain-related protein n=1 Tax=Acinetobacter ursingii TaxID=108980 RepID=UPI000E6AA94C|nr:virulence factor TspB C-terminal domain-related protein [Acinetobacter ursingii]
MKNIILLLLTLFSVHAFAVDRDEYWLQRDISIGQGRNDYGKKVYGQSARSIMQNVTIENSTKEEVRQLIKRSIAVDKPTPAKVGGSMLKRLYSPQAIVGTAAVSGLLAAIGWVMEDGVYVKKILEKDNKDPTKDSYYYQLVEYGTGKFLFFSDNDTAAKATCHNIADPKTWTVVSYVPDPKASSTYEGILSATCNIKRTPNSSIDTEIWAYQRIKNPNYVPEPEPKLKTVPLTGALLGAAMIGRGYKDPDPNFNNDTVNTDDYTGVKEIYEHDPSGVGDEVADDMDDKLKNAKPTDDGKRSWIGDPRYSDEPTNDKDRTQDRSWSDSGDEATGETTPKTDPETGEQTGGSSITIQFPVFCSWAAKMCQWYDDWKVSDKRDEKFQEKVQEHYDDEKTFWDKVTDFFDWTKDDSDNSDQDPDEPDTSSLDHEFDTKFEAYSQCPPNPVIDFPIVGSVELPFSRICDFFSYLRYGVLTGASLLACWIISAAVRGGEA